MKYFKNTSWLFAEKILRMVVGLFVGVWVARYLGAEKFGMLSYAQAFVGLFSAIATLGLNGIVVRELVKYPEKESELLGTAFILKLFGAVLTLFILYIAIQFTSNDSLTNSLIFIIASATIFQAFNVIDFYFQAKVMSKYVVFANSVSLLLSSIVKIVLILNQAPLIYFAFIVLFDSIVLAMGYVYWYFKIKKEFFLKKVEFNLQLAKNLLTESYPLIISFFAISVSLQSTNIILKELLNAQSVGFYSVAQRIVSLFFFIPVVLSQSMFPSLVNSDYKSFIKKAKSISSFLIFLSILISLFLFILSKYIILILYGKEYQSSIILLQILSFSTIFIFFASIRKKLLLVEKETRLISYYSISTGILMVIFSFIFIKIYGVIGAAIAYLFTWIMTIIIVPLLFNRLSEVKLFFSSFNFFNIKIIIKDKKNEIKTKRY